MRVRCRSLRLSLYLSLYLSLPSQGKFKMISTQKFQEFSTSTPFPFSPSPFPSRLGDRKRITQQNIALPRPVNDAVLLHFVEDAGGGDAGGADDIGNVLVG